MKIWLRLVNNLLYWLKKDNEDRVVLEKLKPYGGMVTTN